MNKSRNKRQKIHVNVKIDVRFKTLLFSPGEYFFYHQETVKNLVFSFIKLFTFPSAASPCIGAAMFGIGRLSLVVLY